MADANSSSPSPFVFAPSQAFNGNDGRWSSFILRVGEPEQNFAVLPSTSGHETFIPMPEGCTEADPANCADLRGAYPFGGEAATGFQVNASSTWKSLGLYTLDLGGRLGMTGNGMYGLETVALQVQNSGGLALDGQVVAGIATKTFYMGLFGLGPKPSNFSNYDYPIPSYMQTLKDKQRIPSVSYGYTAGAAYTMPQRYGSLTFGGYDASRFIDSGRSFPFNQDDSVVLSVGVQKITAMNTLLGARSLLTTAVFSIIDSTTPHIWLPKESCDSFAEAFGLTFDNDTELYLVNDTTHERLQSLNPSVTFSLGNDANPSTLVSITLPYGAFDLQASDPIYTNATNYFPIHRAANSSQYTLGRAFLQEAYIIADYERSNFSVHQVQSADSVAKQEIVAIVTPESQNAADDGSEHVASAKLSTAAIPGIAVGSAIPLLLLVLVGCIWYRRRGARSQRQVLELDPSAEGPFSPAPGELSSDHKYEMHHAPSEVLGSGIRFELPAKEKHQLLSDDSSGFVGKPDGINRIHELSGHNIESNGLKIGHRLT